MAGAPARRAHDFNGGHVYDAASQLADLFSPEQPVPTFHTTNDSPERRLMRAVLQDALTTVQVYSSSRLPKQRQKAEEDRAWIAGHGDSWPYSFEGICAVLEIDPDWIHNRLASLEGRKRRIRWGEVASDSQRGNQNAKGRRSPRIVGPAA